MADVGRRAVTYSGHDDLMKFADLGLSDELLRAVSEAGYDEPTPIQAGAIPSVLMMPDMIGIAQTGTGQTESFVLPMIDIPAPELGNAWCREVGCMDGSIPGD